MLLDPFRPCEIEFMAESTMIDVMPSIHMGTLHFISCDYGPFKPMTKAEVPLWLAIALKKTSNFRIIPPSWLSTTFLRSILVAERASDEYQQLPLHYQEIAALILENASDDLVNSEQIRKLIQAIKEARMAKTKQGMSILDGTPLKLNNISLMELNEIRPFLLEAMDRFRLLNIGELEERIAERNLYNSSLEATAQQYSSNPYEGSSVGIFPAFQSSSAFQTGGMFNSIGDDSGL